MEEIKEIKKLTFQERREKKETKKYEYEGER